MKRIALFLVIISFYLFSFNLVLACTPSEAEKYLEESQANVTTSITSLIVTTEGSSTTILPVMPSIVPTTTSATTNTTLSTTTTALIATTTTALIATTTTIQTQLTEFFVLSNPNFMGVIILVIIFVVIGIFLQCKKLTFKKPKSKKVKKH